MGCDFCGIFCVRNGTCLHNICESFQEKEYRRNEKEIDTIIINFFENIDIDNISDIESISNQLEGIHEILHEHDFYLDDEFIFEIIKKIKTKVS